MSSLLKDTMEPYRMRFARVTTADGLPLEGVVFEPDGEPIGAVVIVHGAGSHFYQLLHERLAIACSRAGYRVVSGNNRGHDLGVYLPNDAARPVLGGAAWERFADSVHDVRAWIDFMESELQPTAARWVAIVGHSLGAAKVAHYQASTRDSRVFAVAGLSGLGIGRHRRFRPTDEHVATVRRLVEAGHGEQLLGPPYSGRYISAQTLLERYDRFLATQQSPESDLSRIDVPLFAAYATEEGGTIDLLAQIQQAASATPRCDTYLVQGADHDYHGHEDLVGTELAHWLRSVQTSPA